MKHSPGFPEVDIPRPSRTVEHAASLLEPGSTILDLGAGIGRNGHYLSQLGHRVFSVERDRFQVIEGRRIARALGGRALRNAFIEADMRNLDLGERYDAVIASYSLQSLQKSEAIKTLDGMRRWVKPGGLNVLDIYIASPAQQYEKPGYALFEEGELKRVYEEAGWEMLHYETTGIMPDTIAWDAAERVNKSWINSQDGLIAKETKSAGRQKQLRDLAVHMRISNPEHADELLHQAEFL